ncbi:MAG TPA: phospho-N-acetylmuramoyl-pentapeptide-transferase [Tepidisphaeraceae bacterium]|jgi:phospho-N-acetylmuramoyl-pentapeptide-transferase|nr:phospho-N-acetylmuramoyl-pentapeptide-transferase [Tepidisphaeraceae bacterium]
MLYWLAERFELWLEAHGLGFFRVFTFPTFQSVVAVITSFLIVIFAGPTVISWLRRQKIGDLATFDQAEIDALMASKKGTPTMGGLLIVTAIAGTTLLLADLTNFYVGMALVCLIWLGGVGAADDWLKLTAGRRAGSRVGLTSLEKLLFQVGLGVLLSVFTYYYGHQLPDTSKLYIPFIKDPILQMSLPMFVLVGTLVMTGTSNAVNLTDGLDGLAAGCVAIASFTFLVLALIVGDYYLAPFLKMPHIMPAGQMAVLAGSMAGACLGFLWFNCNPARVFMGDTGSLALGGLLGYIAIVVRHELVLFLVGGIFVAEAVSVMMQVSYFKYTRKRFGEGRRIFLMSPLHHHFQRKGWTETQVVTRFWLVGAMLAMLSLATVKLR